MMRITISSGAPRLIPLGYHVGDTDGRRATQRTGKFRDSSGDTVAGLGFGGAARRPLAAYTAAFALAQASPDPKLFAVS